jgi:GT2 family glycosyltransferase
MISICIPIYNFNVTSLVQELDRQSKLQDKLIELIVIDDASQDIYKAQNKEQCSKHTYIELPRNIGRSAIRNLFLKYAKHNHLLFLDCDSAVQNPSFIANYIAAIKEHPKSVLCGGRVYPTTAPSNDYLLRWQYGIKKESKSAHERSKWPNRAFMTNNFVISKAVFSQIAFDERLKDYGHEDTLFGFELKEKDIAVVHIENPIVNDHLETNQVYIVNTEKAVANLTHILTYTNFNKTLINDVTLLRTYYKYKWAQPLILLCYNLFNKTIKRRLTRGKVSITAFNFYKLGYLSQCLKS